MSKLDIDQTHFERCFGRSPCGVSHRLTDHPLLGLGAIADLADRLPPSSIEHNRGDLAEVMASGDIPRLEGQTPGEIARGIEHNGCWMVLKNIQQDPRYHALLEETLAELGPAAERDGGMTRKEAFIFLSAPESVTPSHIDPEHNLLLQIRGTKTIVVGRFPDQFTEQREAERFYSASDRNLPLKPADAQSYVLMPGDGVYVPVMAPHMVRNGPTVSVSLSTAFFTPRVLDHGRIHAVNARLRRVGFSPVAPGARPRSDRAKLVAARTAKRISRRG